MYKCKYKNNNNLKMNTAMLRESLILTETKLKKDHINHHLEKNPANHRNMKRQK